MSYYNTAPPTPGSKNSITRTATFYGLRDFLLHKNIQNPIKYPYLSTSINGAPKGGEPFLDTMVGTGVIIQHNPIEVDGIPRYNNAIVMNHYKNTDSTAPAFFDIENITQVSIFPNSTAPSGINNYKQEDITLYGLLAKSNEKNYRKISTLKNQYVDATKQIDMADFISLQPVQLSQQVGSYTDEYGALNLGSSGVVQAADIIGSVLNGGLGLAKGGLSTNFDIRSSLVGRVLTSTGLLNDTRLGVIAGQQLALSLANNAAFNSEQLILGGLNAQDNILSLVKNGTLVGFRPDYKITKPTSGVLDYAERILGFNVPKSYVSDAGSIFQSENGSSGNIERANAMLLNTGKGQITALIANMNANLIGTSPNGYDNPKNSYFRSGYAPGFKDNKGRKAINPIGYAFMKADGTIFNFFRTGTKGPIPEINWNRSNMVEGEGFLGLDDVYGNGTSTIKQPTFSWGAFSVDSTDTNKPINANQFTDPLPQLSDKKTMLGKTQQLFNSVGMKNIVSTKGDMTIKDGSQIQSAVAVGGGISKGSGVLSKNKFNPDGTVKGTSDTAENTFCRAWTTFDRYDKVGKLIRHRGLNQTEDGGHIIPEGGKVNGGWRQNTLGSVLGDNGFVKIAPYKSDDLTRQASAPKKYMFSIENLAWVGTPAVNLLPSEQGPGDLLTGKFGRIMWFPPYDITFNETSSVNLESTNFIGRGEPIYTYNNTERTGSLSFKIIVDHPSIMNSFAGDSKVADEYIDSFFAGCVDLDDRWAKNLTGVEKNIIEQTALKNVPKKVVEKQPLPSDFKVYFLNDITVIHDDYENIKGSAGYGSYTAIDSCKPSLTRTHTDGKDLGLNGNGQVINILNKSYNGWIDANYIADLKDFLTNTCPTCRVNIKGHASKQGCVVGNDKLAKDRAAAVKQWFLTNNIVDANRITTSSKAFTDGDYPSDSATDADGPKKQRFAQITFEQAPEKTENDAIFKALPEVTVKAKRLNKTLKNRFYNESAFFEKLTDADSFVFDKIREKIKYFHPAFHSTTPEGLNSRLTFLLQCTRQGPTIKDAFTAKNLAFGPAPVCILRIGDFYNTKIMMDNVSFDFEPLVWDLNPEGVGVQPMIANVTISFKFIGGSTLYSPINKLQNALSFNYFANSQVYDPRADYVAVVSEDTPTIKKERTTFKGYDKESNYSLVTGLDPTNTPMGKISAAQAAGVAAEKAAQVAAIKDGTVITQTTPQTTPSDRSRLRMDDAYVSNAATIFGSVQFLINRKNIATDIVDLTKNYKLKVTISNKNKSSETFQIILPQLLEKTGAKPAQSFSAFLKDMNCTGLDMSKNSYAISVELISGGLPFKDNLIEK